MDSNLTTSFYNELAAVPSLHVGFAVAVGFARRRGRQEPVVKFLALLWGPVIGLAVVATGNHYVFDIVAGVVASAAGLRPRRHGRADPHQAAGRDARPRLRRGLSRALEQIASASAVPTTVSTVLVPTKKAAICAGGDRACR